LEDLGLNRRIILKFNFKSYDGEEVYWIDLAHDTDKWLVLVNTVFNLLVA